ncbi:hypothetical protein DFS34DRAFT_376400 [Phlyctochytrium arcticum]|nr:hypothetical protein DFS34DRAFT_376400 [Phlyctochytrium arcticum]
MATQPGAAQTPAERLTIAAGVAALAAQAELDPLANERIEAEIPDELKEQPPPESLFALDRRMEDLLTDLRALHESRHKDFQNLSGRRDRLAAFQGMSVFEKFKQNRSERLDAVLNIEVPIRPQTAGQAIAEELETGWNLDHLKHDSLFSHLLNFYRTKSTHLLEQNALLLSRWTRFCRTSYDIGRYYVVFQKYQEWLNSEYVDAVGRYERLIEGWEGQMGKTREQEARMEAERIERERRGILTGSKPAVKRAAKGKTGTHAATDGQTGSGPTDVIDESTQSPFGPPELGPSPLFDVGDLAVFLRYMQTTLAGRKHIEMFLQRIKYTVIGFRF